MELGPELACGNAALQYVVERAISPIYVEVLKKWLGQEIQRIDRYDEGVSLLVREVKDAVGEDKDHVPWKHDGVYLFLWVGDELTITGDTTDRWAMRFLKINEEGKFDEQHDVVTFDIKTAH